MVKEILTVEHLSVILIILPFLAAIFCYLIRVSRIRSIVILVTGGVLISSALLLIPLTPYLSGLQVAEPGVFTGPMNQLVKAEAKNYYLSSFRPA
jgi:hypothetical protein